MAKKRHVKKRFNKKIIPIMMLMFVPLIMYFQKIEFDTVVTKPFLVAADNYNDVFSFYKSIAIYIVAFLCLVFYFLYTRKKEMTLKEGRLKYYIPVTVYFIFIIISTIFSIYPKVAVFGLYERFEGALVLISYLIFMVYAIEVIDDEYDLKYILNSFLIVLFIISLIGGLQRIGIDLFVKPFFQGLIGIPEDAQIKSIFVKMAYSTLYNPNNLGQFSALTAPIAAGILMAVKSKITKGIAGLTVLMTLFAGYASGSANFFAGMAVAVVLFVILFFSHIIPKNKTAKYIFFAVMGITVIFIGINSSRIWEKVSQLNVIQSEIKSFKPDEDDIYFNNIEFSDSVIEFDTSQGKYYLMYINNGISFYDFNNKFIPFTQNKEKIRFTEEPYKSHWLIDITSDQSMEVRTKRAYSYTRIDIVFDNEKFLGVWGTGSLILNSVMENQMPEKFRGLETIASRRGYLWIVTFSRLDEVFFIGAGPDNFVYWFEQNDVVGKINFLHTTSILADKPHSMFLQIGSQTGVISLLAFLTLVGIYLISSIKLIGVKRKKTYYELLSAGILCGITGFLASSLFVDSTVGVTPIFYVFLGIGIFANEKIKVMREKEKNIAKKH